MQALARVVVAWEKESAHARTEAIARDTQPDVRYTLCTSDFAHVRTSVARIEFRSGLIAPTR